MIAIIIAVPIIIAAKSAGMPSIFSKKSEVKPTIKSIIELNPKINKFKD